MNLDRTCMNIWYCINLIDKRRSILQVGPSTFFSSKQFEVFDVELLSIQNCQRRTIAAFYSDFVCE